MFKQQLNQQIIDTPT